MCSCGGTPPATPAAPVQGCANPCEKKTFPPREVSHPVTEVISGAPATAAGWNGTYNWDSKFTLTAGRNPCAVKASVKIKVTGTITDAQKTAWKNAIESKWNGKAKLVCPDPSCAAACPGGYPISVEVQFVNSGEHYPVIANNSPPSGGRSVTPDMGTWGVNDTVDITHEFGHMLGNPEEYLTINGHQYTAPDAPMRTPGGTVMNNPAGNPALRNYDVICQEAGTAMGLSCTSQAA
jgi:hypothetical protein